MNFLKTFLASLLAFVVGSMVSSLLVMLMFVGAVGVLVGGLKSDVTYVPEANSVLHIDLREGLVEQEPSAIGELINFSDFSVSSVMTLRKAISTVAAAAEDPNIKGVFLDMPVAFSASTESLYELRTALKTFKESGKFIVGYSDSYGQGSYWLASVADKLYLSPNGVVDWRGLSAEVMFYKGLMDKLGVEPEIFRCGRYKSAVEPYLLTEMSAENREQMQSMIDGIWDVIVSDVSGSRGINDTLLRAYADSSLMAYGAMKSGLVDSLKYRYAVLDEISRLSGTTDDEPKLVGLRTYSKSVRNAAVGDQIAVLYAVGEIADVKGGSSQIVGNTMVAQIEKLRKDDDVKAVVLRVNSPGGSALASDVICDAITRLKAKKPVVVSMGDYAASGGYYISCAADEIWASPSTLTGSIGVFGLMFNVQKGAKEHLGLSTDVVSTNTTAAMSMFHPLSGVQRAQIQRSVDSTYHTFVSVVAVGRGMSYAAVDSVASGRVWTGAQALENGLVDQLGTLEDAIRATAVKIAAASYYVRVYPEGDASSFASIFSSALHSSLNLLQGADSPEILFRRQLKALEQRQGLRMVMPYAIEIE